MECADIIIFSYPAVYILCILPNTISRWLSFSGHNPSDKFVLFANTIFALSGLFNLVLFLWTRPAMVVGESNVIGEDGSATHIAIPSDYASSALGHLPGNVPSDLEKQNSPVSVSLPSLGATGVNNQHQANTRPRVMGLSADEGHGHLPG